jgi:hypothetical protein
VVADLLGVAGVSASSKPVADEPEDAGSGDGGGGTPDGAGGTPELAGVPGAGAAIASDGSSALPLVIALALVAMGLATAVLMSGRPLAGGVWDRRSDRAAEERHEQLVDSVKRILGDRQHH